MEELKGEIRKTKTGYAMNKVVVPMLTEVSFYRPEEWLILRIASDNYIKRFCGNCGMRANGNIYTVRAVSPLGAKEEIDVWICPTCAKKYAPDLQAEADKKNDEANAEGRAEYEADKKLGLGQEEPEISFEEYVTKEKEKKRIKNP